jgi:hypothetical protein
MGWAATMPYFRRLGLSMDRYGDVNGYTDVFDLHGMSDDWTALFGSDLSRKIKTPKQWARHCRRFIKENA